MREFPRPSNVGNSFEGISTGRDARFRGEKNDSPDSLRRDAQEGKLERLNRHNTVIAHLLRHVVNEAANLGDEPYAPDILSEAARNFLHKNSERFTASERRKFRDSLHEYAYRQKRVMELTLRPQLSVRTLYQVFTSQLPQGEMVAIRDPVSFHMMCEKEEDFCTLSGIDVSTEAGRARGERAAGFYMKGYSTEKGISFEPSAFGMEEIAPDIYSYSTMPYPDEERPRALTTWKHEREHAIQDCFRNVDDFHFSSFLWEIRQTPTEDFGAQYASKAGAWMERRIRDEIIAYASETESPNYTAIEQFLIEPESYGGLYDYKNILQRELNRSFLPEIEKEACLSALEHRSSTLYRTELPAALDTLRDMDADSERVHGMQRDLVLRLLAHVPISEWKTHAGFLQSHLRVAPFEMPRSVTWRGYIEDALDQVRAKHSTPRSEQLRVRKTAYQHFNIANKPPGIRLAFLEMLVEYGLANECELEDALATRIRRR